MTVNTSSVVAGPTATVGRVASFGLSVSKGRTVAVQRVRLRAVIEHLEHWADASIVPLEESPTVLRLSIVPRCPVRLQAAEDIAKTCPHYVAGSFEVAAPPA